MKLEYYKSEKGIYVAQENISYLNRRELLGKRKPILINGKVPEKTNHVSWLFISGESELLSLSAKVTGEKHNYRWELKESTPELVADTLPKVITKEDASEYCDDYELHIGKECEYHEYRSFYTRKHDVKPDYFKNSEIEISFLGDIQSDWVANPREAKYSVWRSSYKHEGDTTLDVSDIASFSELSQILTPDLLLHNQPCSLASAQTYKIIRKYVSDNIDPKWANITSDYDFCFTVKKKIAIKPWVRKTEQVKRSGRSYAKPRFNVTKITHKEEQIFEMTHAGRGGNYRGYTPISGFKGDSLQELIDNIEQYLNELIGYINLPLSQCDHCNGTGHVFDDLFEVNKR
jgi:hypothetical protein